MRAACLVLPLALLLGACGSDGAPGPKERIQNEDARPDVLPVMGAERRITVIAAGMLDGAGLAAADAYPARLETALRVRGVNARMSVAKGWPVPAPPPELIVTTEALPGRSGVLVIGLRVPKGLAQEDGVHPDAQGVEELVEQSADKVAAALPPAR